MAKFNLSTIVGDLVEKRTVSDPWGAGWTFEVQRLQNRDFLEWQREQQLANPLYRKVTEGMARAAVMQMAKRNSNSEEVQEQVMTKIAEELVLEDDVLKSFFGQQAEGVARHILCGWSGITDTEGNEVEFSVEAAIALLGEVELLPDGLPYGGQSIGAALQAFILEVAGETEAFRRQQEEEAVDGLAQFPGVPAQADGEAG